MVGHNILFQKHLEAGERIKYAVHKHWIEILAPCLELVFMGFILPWGLYFILLSSELWFLISSIWSMAASIRFLYMALSWYGDVILVTNQSLIQVQWGGFFNNSATRILYESVEGVAYDINGFWPTVLGYGQVTLKVNSGNNLLMSPVSQPKRMEVMVANQQKEYLAHKGLQDSAKLKDLMTQMVGHYLRER